MPSVPCLSSEFLICFFRLLTFCFAVQGATGDSYTAPSANSTSTSLPKPIGTAPTTAHSGGRGIEYAESCQAALRAWSSSSRSYGHNHGHKSISLYSSHMTIHSVIEGTTKVSSLTTLCDGHPRVIGSVQRSAGSTTTYVESWTNSNPTFVYASFTTAAPCSIGPEDCKLLYSSWTSHWSQFTRTNSIDGLPDPPCTIPTTTRSYSTNSKGGQCDNCLVAGHKIRLLYWPVLTVPGSGDLCNLTAETISATPTGDGPNTFVTDGLTITSPTVAVSIGGLSRVDQCGSTVAETIIPVLPEDITSVQGARALFTHKPFNFADLNYKCISDPNVVYFTDKGRDDCYQEVPASAYFYGYANAAGADWYMPNAFENRTIWPNYNPQVLPPMTLTEAIRSIWGKDCYIHPDGIWDPPIALVHQSSLPLPNDGPGAPTEYSTPTSYPAMPGEPTHKHITPTAMEPPPATSEHHDPQSETDPAIPTPSVPKPNISTPSVPIHGISTHRDPEISLISVNKAGRAVYEIHSTTITIEQRGDRNGGGKSNEGKSSTQAAGGNDDRQGRSGELSGGGSSGATTDPGGDRLTVASQHPYTRTLPDLYTIDGRTFTHEVVGRADVLVNGRKTMTLPEQQSLAKPKTESGAATTASSPTTKAEGSSISTEHSGDLHGSSTSTSDSLSNFAERIVSSVGLCSVLVGTVAAIWAQAWNSLYTINS